MLLVGGEQYQTCGEDDTVGGVPTQRDACVHSNRPSQISHCLLDLLPALEAPPFKGQRLEGLPPGLDQVQVGGSGGLKDELEAADKPD